MNDLFAADYGTLEQSFFERRYVTNAAELIRGAELYRILRLCGIEAAECGERASDYELFRAFCESCSLLPGHLSAQRMAKTLRTVFSLSEAFSGENARELWRKCVFRLEEKPLASEELFRANVPWLCDRAEIPSCIPRGTVPVLNAAFLEAEMGEARAAWHARMCGIIEAFSDAGAAGVRFLLPADFSFVPPNPHSVDKVLSSVRRTAADRNLLLSQLLREMAPVCRARSLPVTLECAHGASAAELLSYVAGAVGLPDVTVGISEARQVEALLSFAEKYGGRIALQTADFPTEGELTAALECIAARYPIGRVRLIVGADLRHAAAARALSEELLGRILKKKL